VGSPPGPGAVGQENCKSSSRGGYARPGYQVTSRSYDKLQSLRERVDLLSRIEI
jgi:hypothetical protein